MHDLSSYRLPGQGGVRTRVKSTRGHPPGNVTAQSKLEVCLLYKLHVHAALLLASHMHAWLSAQRPSKSALDVSTDRSGRRSLDDERHNSALVYLFSYTQFILIVKTFSVMRARPGAR